MRLSLSQYSILLESARRQYSNMWVLKFWHDRSVFTLGGVWYNCKVLAQVINVYTELCLVYVWIESWVVKFWHEHSVFTLGCVGYKFGLSLRWQSFGKSVQCLQWVVLDTSLC